MSIATASLRLGKTLDPQGLNRGVAWKLRIARKQAALAEAVRHTQSERPDCPICGARRWHVYVEVYAYPYVECEECGHLFLQRLPSAAAVRALYASERGDTKSVQSDVYGIAGLFERRVATIAAPKVDYVTRHLGRAGRWIDVGAGVGELVVAAQRAGWDCLGLEVDPEEVRFAESVGARVRRVELEPGNASALLESADVVSLLNLAEHVVDPAAFLGFVAKAMPSWGRVVIEVPRHPSFSSFALRCMPGVAHRHIYPPDHLHVFSDRSLDRLLARCELDAEHVWRFGQDAYELIMSLACARGGGGDDVEEAVRDSVPALQEAIDRCGLSDVLFVIARKV